MNLKKLIKQFKMRNIFINLCAFLCVFAIISCENDDKNTGTEYNPDKPVVLTSFYPDSGKIAEKIILDGANFGSDPDKIRVYFNNKKAAVIGSSGKRMYAIVPKLPGDTCIVSVVVGNDSLTYSQKFRYKISVTVSTIVGNGTSSYSLGTNLSNTTFQPNRLCVDDEGNIFTLISHNSGTILKINEAENSVIQVATSPPVFGWAAAPSVNRITGVLSFPSDNDREMYYTLDPKEGWALKTRYMKFEEGASLPPHVWKKATAVNEIDGCIYTLFYDGHLVKINPTTSDTKIICVLQAGGSGYGLAFHPINKNILYLPYDQSAGVYAHTICTIDVTDPDNTFQKIAGVTTGGHRDGELALAQFRNPQQIFFDPEGNLYIADTGNHCIRKITTDNMVETVVGIPGIAGWKDGGKDEALFNKPQGINVDKNGVVYVGDVGNSRIRKLAIE